MKFNTNIHDAQRINPSDFDDPLASPIAAPIGQRFYLCLLISTPNLWIATKFCAGIHGPHSINPK